MDFREYIEIDPKIRFGKPVLKGTRISVIDVLEWLSNGQSHQEILADFPELTDVQIRACLAYAVARERLTAATSL